MAQPVETATDYRHTNKDFGLIMVTVYGFVFHFLLYIIRRVQTGELGNTDIQTHIQTHKQTDATKRIIYPASRSIKIKVIALALHTDESANGDHGMTE